jgi:hypothetical protein
MVGLLGLSLAKSTAECQTSRGVEFPERKIGARKLRIDEFRHAQRKLQSRSPSRLDRRPRNRF